MFNIITKLLSWFAYKSLCIAFIFSEFILDDYTWNFIEVIWKVNSINLVNRPVIIANVCNDFNIKVNSVT